MKIAIIGLGRIGSALGPLLAQAHHEVVYGIEHPHGPPPPHTRAEPVADAIEGADAVVVAIPFGAWVAFAQGHGRSDPVPLHAEERAGEVKLLKRLARPERFERPTLRFVEAKMASEQGSPEYARTLRNHCS